VSNQSCRNSRNRKPTWSGRKV